MRRLLACLLSGFAVLVLAAPADAAWHAPCMPEGPTCTWWNARTVFVADGDTIRVRVSGGHGIATIRFTGINAMELHRYSSTASKRRGDCHGVEATNLVDRLIKHAHGRVGLAAQTRASHSNKRLRRSVWVRSGGKWRDV